MQSIKDEQKKKRRILIVDDNKICNSMMSKMFSDEFTIEEATDGNAALFRLRHHGSAISVVLLDLFMPGMNGFAVLRRMQESLELRNIPVIVVSSDENRETGLEAIRAGAVDFVTKPVDPEILRIRIRSAISKSENERLMAKNRFLEYKNNEVLRYKTVLERSGTVIIEYDWTTTSFIYGENISLYIAGIYDDRKLWRILLSDFVADTQTVRKIQELIHLIAMDRERTDGSIFVQLKTPSKATHWFKMCVYKLVNDLGTTDKLYLTFNDHGTVRPMENGLH